MSEYVITRINDEKYLEHHGVKGQKWGIRRYQNEDGSLTPEGEKQRAKIEKWYNSGSGQRSMKSFEKKGMTDYDAYKAHRMTKGGAIGYLAVGGVGGAALGAYVSHKRVTAGKEFFESEILRLSKQQKKG